MENDEKKGDLNNSSKLKLLVEKVREAPLKHLEKIEY